MKKYIYKYGIMICDFVNLSIIFYISNFLSNKFTICEHTNLFLICSLIFALIKVIFHLVFSDYNILWMYRTKNNYVKMVIIFLLSNIIIFITHHILVINNIIPFSYSTLLISFILEFCYIIISRFTINMFLENCYRKIDKSKEHKKTLIIGAGSCGSMILSEIGLNKEYCYNVVGFVDDSLDKINTKINNVKVYGPIAKINDLIKKLKIEEVIIAIPTINKERLTKIVNEINYKSIHVHIVPRTSILLEGTISKTLRKVSISDLLGRDEINLNESNIYDFINNQVVLVTGGGGSIGSEICRQVLKYNPKQLIIFDIYENTAYNLLTELDIFYRNHNEIKKPNYFVLIGSVRDVSRIEEVIKKYRPNIIFHAAAHKHVPLMEDSPKEAIKNNVIGTYNVCQIADKYSVKKMVLISTDKAVNPTNVMGASKRFCEIITEAWNNHSKNTKYSMVRFGNVLGSNGSVIPLFEKQIQTGGPITLTDDRITRYFMTIPEACSLVIQSGAYANGGEKFILDMGKPIKIIDLAKNMIRLSGLELDKDISINIIGLRPGEKLYEELLLDYSKAKKTDNDKIFVEECINPLPMKEIEDIIANLLNLKCFSNKEILDFLNKVEKFKLETNKVLAK